MDGMELWLDITGYEGLYQVSNLGRVRSLDRSMICMQARYKDPVLRHRKGKILKAGFNNNKRTVYYVVMLCKGGVPKNHRVHRLVALHFVPNPFGKPAVNHIDGNSLNNAANNLEWCTVLENNRHTIKLGRYASGKAGSIYKSFFNLADRKQLYELFEHGVGVTAIAYQLNLPYGKVRHIYRLWLASI